MYWGTGIPSRFVKNIGSALMRLGSLTRDEHHEANSKYDQHGPAGNAPGVALRLSE